MTIYIDTESFSATPAIFANPEKTIPLPRVIPAVQLNEGFLRVGFLGDHTPAGNDVTVCAAASIPNPGAPVRVLTSYGVALAGEPVPTWEIPVNLNATEIADALTKRGSVNIAFGIVVESTSTRREYQMWVNCVSSAQGEISPEETADAKTFADAARLSADNAAESESNAAQSATNAANSASAAAESATNASNSASNAETSATNAEQSATDAASSASAAKTSKTNAKTSETNAAQSKEDAQTAASSAADSASNAAKSESASGTFASNAKTSATNAEQSATDAASSASAAKASETAAKSSQTAAANSASSASTSATNAGNSASAAKTSETNAGNSATAAAGSAKQAAQSAEQAEETLQNVYTKAESDAALATKADATALEAETQAREQADTALGERIDANAENFSEEMAKMRLIMSEIGEVIWFTLTIPEDDGTHERWITDDGTHERDNNPPTFARYYDAQTWLLTTTDGGTATIDWGDGTVESFANVASLELCHKFTVAGTYEFTATGGVKSLGFVLSNGYLPNKDAANRMRDMNLVFNAATIRGAALSGAMSGATAAKTCYYSAPAVYSTITSGMLDSPDSTIYAELSGNNAMVLHMHKFGKVCLSANGATSRLSLFTEGKQVIQYSVFAPDLKDLEWTYITNTWTPPAISYYAPNVVNANGRNYYAFYGATKLRTLLYGFPAVQSARDAFKNTNLDAASVVRILKALPDLSADTEHLPDLSITNFDDAYYGYRIVTFTTTVSTAAVKTPTAEMWAAYDDAVAKGWLVEGFEGTHP